MKRSEINAIMQKNLEFISKMGFRLPPFAYFTPQEWQEKGHEYDEIRNHMLGWDITDYGHGDFEKIGLFYSRCATALSASRTAKKRMPKSC